MAHINHSLCHPGLCMYKNYVFICGVKAFYSDYGTDTSNQLQRWRQFYVYLLNVWGTCPKGGGVRWQRGHLTYGCTWNYQNLVRMTIHQKLFPFLNSLYKLYKLFPFQKGLWFNKVCLCLQAMSCERVDRRLRRHTEIAIWKTLEVVEDLAAVLKVENIMHTFLWIIVELQMDVE